VRPLHAYTFVSWIRSRNEENDAEEEDCDANPEAYNNLVQSDIGADCQGEKPRAISEERYCP